MKTLRQFTIIALISLAGEMLSRLLPLTIPSSIYGITLLFALLCTGVLHVGDIREAASFLIEIMPVLFIPAGVGLMTSFGLLLPALPAYAVITVVSTVLVMAAAGLSAQAVIRKTARKEHRHE